MRKPFRRGFPRALEPKPLNDGRSQAIVSEKARKHWGLKSERKPLRIKIEKIQQIELC